VTSHHLTISGSLISLVFLINEKVGFGNPQAVFTDFSTGFSTFETVN
jgi:hypothetical protein